MKVLVVVVILIHVSQHALAVLVQAYEGMESVLLPCQYSGNLPEFLSVVWNRSDVNSTVIHLLKYESDDLKEEQRYSERTTMKTNVLESGDFSLTLRKPQLSDSSKYTCSIRWETKQKGTKERRLTQVQLQVKDDQEEVEVQEGAESIQLPCKASANLPEDTTVTWTHIDPQPMVVHVYRNKTDDPETQDKFYFGRTEMNKDRTLTLKYPRDRDRGMYICTVYREGDVLRSKVLLQLVEGGFPTWAIVLLVLVFLAVLLIILGVLFNFHWYFLSVYKVEVDSGKEFVLPCKTTAHLTKNFRHIRVEWKDSYDTLLYVYEDGSSQPDEQDEDYSNRTEMNKHLLKTGDFSLKLKHPMYLDRSTYTCTVYNKDKVLKIKPVVLEVKVQQIEVDSGKKSVLLPWKTTLELMEDVRQVTVQWTAESDEKVHVYQYRSDRTNEQDDKYRNRTEMNKDPLKTGDLSLTLKHPINLDTGIYTCTVYNRRKEILRRKQVKLKVIVQQIKVDSGKESVLLPWKTTFQLMEDVSQVTVEWTDGRNRKLHVYQYRSDQTNEQDDKYRNRTEMNKDPLKTRDLSLTLKHLMDLDNGIYTCTVYNRDKEILRRKQVELKVKVQQIKVDSGKESVLLPWKTTFQLMEDVTVEWTDRRNRKVHVYPHRSDRTNEQDDKYRNRTEMNKDPLKTGDLSLTLKHPMNLDPGIYTCIIYNRDKEILRRKQVMLEVKDQQVEVEEGAKSALLPFSTTTDLPQDARVVWRYYPSAFQSIDVHVYEKNSAQLGEQDNRYRNRTKMNEDPWTTGDFSLTLNDLQHDDSGLYTCKVIRGVTLREKWLVLKVKGQRVKEEKTKETSALLL